MSRTAGSMAIPKNVGPQVAALLVNHHFIFHPCTGWVALAFGKLATMERSTIFFNGKTHHVNNYERLKSQYSWKSLILRADGYLLSQTRHNTYVRESRIPTWFHTTKLMPCSSQSQSKGKPKMNFEGLWSMDLWNLWNLWSMDYGQKMI